MKSVVIAAAEGLHREVSIWSNGGTSLVIQPQTGEAGPSKDYVTKFMVELTEAIRKMCNTTYVLSLKKCPAAGFDYHDYPDNNAYVVEISLIG